MTVEEIIHASYIEELGKIAQIIRGVNQAPKIPKPRHPGAMTSSKTSLLKPKPPTVKPPKIKTPGY